MEKLIKKVDEKSWREFKAESARHGMKMGEFLGHLLTEHKKTSHNGNAWDMILKRKRWITDQEAEQMVKANEAFEQIEDFE